MADSPLCDRCQPLFANLEAVIGLRLADKNLPDTLWGAHRPYTWKISWSDEISASTRCPLCLILVEEYRLGYGVVPRIGAHSARTLFRTNWIQDTVIFEVFSRSATLFLPLSDGVAQSQDDSHRMERQPCVTARVIDPVHIDYSLLRQWMRDCSIHHGIACSGDGSRHHLEGLKVLDCDTRKIVFAQDGCKYAALSYLWGQRRIVTTTHPAQRNDGLDSNVPRVVEDAIVVARELGIRYLWVDKYCINQTDNAEKHHLIRHMDRIYNDATVTIVAAAGDDASFGLPGVSTAPRQRQASLTLGGRRFLAFPDSTVEVRHSKWSTRAWTYQEGLLSRRRLVFTGSQVYFQCMKAHCWEGLSMPAKMTNRTSFDRIFPEDGIGQRGGDIVKRLSEYASRQLSFESDALNAVLGIFRAYQAKRVYHLWGLPFDLSGGSRDIEQDFAMGLGWNTRLPENAVRREQFPSWSWVGWKNLDTLTVPWPHERLPVEGFRGLHVAVRAVELSSSGSPARTIPLYEYVIRVSAGADFTNFSQSIILRGHTTMCRVRSPWKVDVDLPRVLTVQGSTCIVRMMAVSEADYGNLSQEVLTVLYLGCQAHSNIVFSFLILRHSRVDEYTRAGTLTITAPLQTIWGSYFTEERMSSYFMNSSAMPSHTYDPIDWRPDVNQFFQKNWTIRECKLV